MLCCITISFVTPGLSSGRTVWSTAPGSWSRQTRLHGQERSVSMPDSESELDSAAAYVASKCMSVHRSLYTTQPSWCSYQGVTSWSVSGSSRYASVISISITFLELFGIHPSEIGSFGSLGSLDGRNNGISVYANPRSFFFWAPRIPSPA